VIVSPIVSHGQDQGGSTGRTPTAAPAGDRARDRAPLPEPSPRRELGHPVLSGLLALVALVMPSHAGLDLIEPRIHSVHEHLAEDALVPSLLWKTTETVLSTRSERCCFDTWPNASLPSPRGKPGCRAYHPGRRCRILRREEIARVLKARGRTCRAPGWSRRAS
jgi:hypothetical protein